MNTEMILLEILNADGTTRSAHIIDPQEAALLSRNGCTGDDTFATFTTI